MNTSDRQNGQHERDRSNGSRINYKRLCLNNVPMDLTRHNLRHGLLKDFPVTNIHMPLNTHDKSKKRRLAFVDFDKTWIAKVARRVVNLTNCSNITADFSIDNTKDPNDHAPELIERCTMFSDGPVPETGKCSHCERPGARFVCQVCFTLYCGTFYCNEDHQSQDWNRHKVDCKALPKLELPLEFAEAITQAIDDKSKKKFFVPYVDSFEAGSFVKITHFVNDRVLFVRPLKEDFLALEQEIEMYASKAAKLSDMPEVNDTVFAFFDGIYRRAQVVDTFEPDSDGNDLMCFFLDYGYSRKCQWQSLRKLVYRLRSVPRQTFKVTLEDVTLNSSQSKIIEPLYEQQVELEVIRIVERHSELFVVLKRRGQIETVNESIRRVQMIQSDDERILFDGSKVVKLRSGTNIKIRVTDVAHLQDGFISCMATEQFPLFWKKDNEIQDYGRSRATLEPYEPILHELCLVKYEGRWERGAVTDIKPNEIQMALVDRFAIRTIPKANVRKLPAKFATDFFSQLCYIESVNEANLATAQERIKLRTNIVADLVAFDEDKNQFSLVFNFLSD